MQTSDAMRREIAKLYLPSLRAIRRRFAPTGWLAMTASSAVPKQNGGE
ncbi:hypothetical protein V1286_002347 [Bradyrhizobium algeriense]|uniref:Uncharacterized protein n=1 Tax=Bradyrhizobium algeriense TaxID=634784 RepID=A0ABU8B8F8_9BRAD